MKYSAKGKTGFVFVGIGVLGFPACLISGNIPFLSILFGCVFWAGLGVLLIFFDRKSGGKKYKSKKAVPPQTPTASQTPTSPQTDVFSHSPRLDEYSPWLQWESEHESIEQLKRIRRASAKEFMCRNLDSCDCPDFEKRGLPCKHMYYLASKMKLICFDDYLK